MTTLVDFQPSSQSAFQFQATLDGLVYTIIVTWNLFGQRYYINVYDVANNLIVCKAIVGSPVGVKLQGISWETGFATGLTIEPHGFKVGSTINLTIDGVTPAGYNGTFECFITSPQSFTYPLADDPVDVASVLGSVSYNVDLLGGYFESTLVYRQANAQFEVSP